MKSLTLLLLSSLSFAAVAPTGTFTVDPSKSNVEFTAIGRPSMIKIVGKSGGPSGTLTNKNNQLQGELSIDLEGFKTGIDLRDRHMREKYLETSKYPKATLKLESFPLKSEMGQQSFKEDGIPFTGTLSLHGVEKPINGTANITREGNTATAVASFKTKTSDFNITTPSFAGVTVAEEVDVKVNLQGDVSAAAPEAKPAAPSQKKK